MKEIIIDGLLMTDKERAHAEIARELCFPEYYGANLDALWDMLTTLCDDTDVTLINAPDMLNCLGAYGCELLRTFFEAQEESRSFRFCVLPSQDEDDEYDQ